jgi:hypothetical protein
MKTWYTKQGLWSLFLMCAVLLHLWAIILIARDMSWVTDRTNAWDAVGVAAYGLMFILVESLLLFLAFVVLGFLTPRSWAVDRRVAFLSALALILAFWAILSQLYFLAGLSFPSWFLGLVASTGRPVFSMYIFFAGIVGASVLLPALWLARSEKSLKIWREVTDRLALLAGFYLFFDFIGLVVILTRNIG